MSVVQDIVAANRSGLAVGLPSWCTAHPQTLAAILAAYRDDQAAILIEATCNQVNQFGGYTGMTPPAFRRFVEAIAKAEGVDPARLVLGGDHLGPNPWRRKPSASAMENARTMVADYVASGFSKIHLDASMACADDEALGDGEMAARAADLAQVAEETAVRYGLPLPVYVIGTEVPVPGGEVAGSGAVQVTQPAAAALVLELHRDAFARRGLQAALARVVAIVVQPGVDYSNHDVMAFDPAGARGLSAAVADLTGVAFEAHSTDYQTEAALAALVAGHFAILKVGPELTWAYARAIEGLAAEEQGMAAPSQVLATLRGEMTADPVHWQGYLAPGDNLLTGLSDRMRYYWPRPPVQAALARLENNLGASRVQAAVSRRVGAVVTKYRGAAGELTGSRR